MTGILIALQALGDVVSISPRTIIGLTGSPAMATAGYLLSSSGKVQKNTNGSVVDIGDWVIPNGSASEFECFATPNPDTPTSGVMNTWLPLTITNEWDNSVSSGTNIGTFNVKIRRIGTAQILTNADITLDAEST